MNKSKNDIAWGNIFDIHKIMDSISANGYCSITSTDINKFREARLMTKFDHKLQLPKLFADNNLSILPTSRGDYVIGTFETFSNFDTDDIKVTPIKSSISLESLDYQSITSETTAINCAFISEILQDFTDEKRLFPTVSGRMSSSSFSFDINYSKGKLFKINVENSQIEIDGGYEGDNSLNLIEAKNYISTDFLIRQLYYPYKLWRGKIKKKKVRPIFLTYTNGIFDLREYCFKNIDHYNSLVLIKHKRYAIQDSAFKIKTLQEILHKTKIIKEPKISFPQADSFERIINLCELLNQKEFITKEEITQSYDFDPRQADYYSNAGRYLGLLEKGQDPLGKQTVYSLTKKGKQIFNTNLIDRQMEFVKIVISHSVFNKTLNFYFENREMPSKNKIVEIMKRSKLYKVDSDVTYYRRSSTITSWINWIIKQIEE